jgi:hypothetical protein
MPAPAGRWPSVIFRQIRRRLGPDPVSKAGGRGSNPRVGAPSDIQALDVRPLSVLARDGGCNFFRSP